MGGEEGGYTSKDNRDKNKGTFQLMRSVRIACQGSVQPAQVFGSHVLEWYFTCGETWGTDPDLYGFVPAGLFFQLITIFVMLIFVFIFDVFFFCCKEMSFVKLSTERPPSQIVLHCLMESDWCNQTERFYRGFDEKKNKGWEKENYFFVIKHSR